MSNSIKSLYRDYVVETIAKIYPVEKDRIRESINTENFKESTYKLLLELNEKFPERLEWGHEEIESRDRDRMIRLLGPYGYTEAELEPFGLEWYVKKDTGIEDDEEKDLSPEHKAFREAVELKNRRETNVYNYLQVHKQINYPIRLRDISLGNHHEAPYSIEKVQEYQILLDNYLQSDEREFPPAEKFIITVYDNDFSYPLQHLAQLFIDGVKNNVFEGPYTKDRVREIMNSLWSLTRKPYEELEVIFEEDANEEQKEYLKADMSKVLESEMVKPTNLEYLWDNAELVLVDAATLRWILI